MKYLKIQNDGLLDIRLLSLMGGTTKANDSFKIGQWGSGLKYSMAYLLRNNLSFRVFIGSEEVKITTEVENIRGEDFEIIHVNGEKTSVTTNMGGDAWKPWMIVREIWCNALDEGGNLKEVTTDCFGNDGKTTFFIQMTPDFMEVYNNWDKYFIHDLPVLHTHGYYSVYENFDNCKLYKQGVLIKSFDAHSIFKYDIKDATLNELREFNGSGSYPIVHALENLPKHLCLRFFEKIENHHFEATMSWDWYTSFSRNWVDCLGDKKLIHDGIIAAWLFAGKGFNNLENTICVPKKVYDFFVKEFPEIGVTKVTEKGEFVESENYELQKKVDYVISKLIDCGYNMVNGVKITLGTFDDKSVIGRADINNKEILLGHQLSTKTNHYIASTIIEENEHIRTGFSDESREFQQHFIDLYTKELFERNGIEC